MLYYILSCYSIYNIPPEDRTKEQNAALPVGLKDTKWFGRDPKEMADFDESSQAAILDAAKRIAYENALIQIGPQFQSGVPSLPSAAFGSGGDSARINALLGSL